MNRRYLFVVTGRNCIRDAWRCLDSLEKIEGDHRVMVVDDCSDDGTASTVLTRAQEHFGEWGAILNGERKWALANQVAAWEAMGPRDDDVIVFVDLDDALNAPRVTTEILDRYYDQGAWMTYGSYAPWPSDDPSAKTCAPATPYPASVVQYNQFRAVRPFFNHLRTVSWRVLKHVTDAELRDDRTGEYFKANTDEAVMMPCLELSGSHTAFVSEVLYRYTCDSPDAVWRTQLPLLQEERGILRNREPRRPL